MYLLSSRIEVQYLRLYNEISRLFCPSCSWGFPHHASAPFCWSSALIFSLASGCSCQRSIARGNRILPQYRRKHISRIHAQEDLRCSGKIYSRGLQSIDASEEAATLPHPQPGGSAPSCCRPALVCTKPRMRVRSLAQSCCVISVALAAEASVVQNSLSSLPVCV